MIFGRSNKKDQAQAKLKVIKDALRGKLPRKIKPLGMWLIHGDEVQCPDGSIITKAEFDARQKDEDDIVWNEVKTYNEMVIGDLSPITDIVVNVVKPKDFEKNLIFESASGCLHEQYEIGNATYLAGKPEPREPQKQTIGKRIKNAVDNLFHKESKPKETPEIAPQPQPEKLTVWDEQTWHSDISLNTATDQWAKIREQLGMYCKRNL